MRRTLIAVLLAALAAAACSNDTTPTSQDGTPAPTAEPDSNQATGDADSVIVEVDGYVYGDAPASWKPLIDAIDAFADDTVDSAIRTVRKGEQAVAIVWVTVVEEAKELDQTSNEQLRAQAEADALAEYEGRKVAESEVKVFADARIVHAQPRDEGWKHIYFWPVRPSTIVRFAGDDATEVEAFIEAFVRAG